MTNTTRPAEEEGGNGAALLPCPFCGAVGLDFGEGSTFRWITAECSGCGATTGETRIQTFGEGTRDEWLADARQDAIAAWNRRAVPGAAAAAPAEVEIKPPYWGAVHAERGGRIELSPQQYRQVLDGAFLRGVDAARAAQEQGGKA